MEISEVVVSDDSASSSKNQTLNSDAYMEWGQSKSYSTVKHSGSVF